MAVTRFQADGAIDATFGSNGTAVVDFGVSTSGVELALQPDAKIVIFGYLAGPLQPDGKIVALGNSGISDAVQKIGVARFETDGTLDTTSVRTARRRSAGRAETSATRSRSSPTGRSSAAAPASSATPTTSTPSA